VFATPFTAPRRASSGTTLGDWFSDARASQNTTLFSQNTTLFQGGAGGELCRAASRNVSGNAEAPYNMKLNPITKAGSATNVDDQSNLPFPPNK
jgi:hypothetical protein